MHSISYPIEQPIDSGAWSNGFLPSQYQGVRFLPGGRPVVFLENPAGISDADRRRTVQYIAELSAAAVREVRRSGDLVARQPVRAGLSHAKLDLRKPSISATSPTPPSTCTARTRASPVPSRTTASRRGDSPSATSSSCSSYHRAWDHHDSLPTRIEGAARASDQPSAALVMDLKQRGLLEDTLVIWGGEFGRTSCLTRVVSRRSLTAAIITSAARTYWMAGGGVKAGYTHGETDDFSFGIVKDPVHMHDLHATLLHLMGIDHEKLTYRYQGVDFRLTDVSGKIIRPLLS